MKNILITGSNGLIGRCITEALLKTGEYNIFGLSAGTNKIASTGFVYESCDLTDSARTGDALKRIQPHVIIHTAAMGSPDACESNRAQAWAINVEASALLAEYAHTHRAFLLHWSTDFVFDGMKGNYSENDEPNPVSYYGLTKWESEKAVTERCPSACIFRTALVYGIYPLLTRPNILTRILDAALEQKPMRVATDQFRTPTFVDDLAAATRLAVTHQPSGIFHVSGSEYISVYDFVLLAAAKLGVESKWFSPVISSDLNEKARRPLKTGFDISRARMELGYSPHTLDEALRKIQSLSLI